VEDIILCPGNHDSRYVNETKKRKDYSIFEPKSTKKPENRRYEVVFSLDHIEERAKSQFDGYSNACSQLGLAGLSNYTKGRVLYLFGTRKHKDSGFIFVVLNSAWNSFPHRISGNGYDQGALFLSDIIVDDVMDTLESRNDEIVITLLHHPVSFMHPIELTAYDSDHPQSVVDRVVSFSDIILNGHIHGMIKPPDTLENKTLNFKGGTLHDNDQSPLRQFEILSINKHDRSCMQYVGSLHGMTWTVKPLGMEYYFGVGKRVQELSARIGQGLITPDQVIAGEFTSIPVELSEEIDELTRWVFSRLFYLNNKCSDIERLSDKALEYYYGRGVQARTIQKLLKMTPPKRKGDE
jgi:hypothetical protein